ncbi:MAG: hypothetical protein K2M48_05910 [Clostridiales bacterium]|nr:hypothetical protein [Clostridiales bacterium]
MKRMLKNKGYKNFSRNQILINILWALVIVFSIVCIGTIIGACPLWAIILLGCTSLIFIAVSIITTVLLNCRLSNDGITIGASRRKKRFVSWDDLNSVQITCRYGRNRAYIVQLKSDSISIKIRAYDELIATIKEFSKNCENFKRMFSESLDKAEKEETYIFAP